MQPDAAGYVVVCFVFHRGSYSTPRERYELQYRAELTRSSELFRDGEVLVRDHVPIFVTDGDDRCGIMAVKVKSGGPCFAVSKAPHGPPMWSVRVLAHTRDMVYIVERNDWRVTIPRYAPGSTAGGAVSGRLGQPCV
jgi:hypothetical protein